MSSFVFPWNGLSAALRKPGTADSRAGMQVLEGDSGCLSGLTFYFLRVLYSTANELSSAGRADGPSVCVQT